VRQPGGLLRDLTARQCDRLIARVETTGLSTRCLDPQESLPYDYLSEGVCLYRGELLWAWDGICPATLDAFCHEAGHALQLEAAERAEWEYEDIRTDESLAMAVQVELQRGIRGLGMVRAVDVMQAIDYFSDTTGQRWLRRKSTRAMLAEPRALLARLAGEASQ